MSPVGVAPSVIAWIPIRFRIAWESCGTPTILLFLPYAEVSATRRLASIATPGVEGPTIRRLVPLQPSRASSPMTWLLMR